MASLPLITRPQSLTQWQKQLKPMALPVDPTIKIAAIQKLRSANGNATNVAELIAEDPVLTLRLVHNANKALMPSGNEVTSLPHAISLLGFPGTEKILRDAPEYDSETFIRLPIFRQQLSISLHAACQLQGWSEHNRHWADERLWLATLLQRAPLWALWHQAPDLMGQLYQCRLQSGGHHQAMEKRMLGGSLQAIAATLSRQWHLPTLTQLSWFPSERGHPRQWILLSRIIPDKAKEALERFPELHRLAMGKPFAIALGNRLAEAADWDWYSRHTLRLQNLLANSLTILLPEAIALTHRQAAVASREYSLRNTDAPGNQLLRYYRRQIDALQTAKEPTGVPREMPPQAPASKPEKEPLAITQPLRQLMTELRNAPERFNSLHTLFDLTVKTLCSEVSFERATVSLLHPKTRELRVYYNHGCDNSPELQRFHHALQRGDLFNRLLRQPAGIHLHSDNHTQIWPNLPGEFKQACGADQFVMMSVFADKKPIGIVYADHGISNRAISKAQYAQFKQFCSAINACLQQQVKEPAAR